MPPETDSAADPTAVEELRFLGDFVHRVDVATDAIEWDDDAAVARIIAIAWAELTSMAGAIADDIAATVASAKWRARAADQIRTMSSTADVAAPSDVALANAVVAVALARAAVAEAVLAVALTRNASVDVDPSASTRRIAVLRLAPVAGVGRRVIDEVRHVVADRPRAVLVRLLITLAISLSLVTVQRVSGRSEYDGVSQLTLYLFSAVVGSVVCTNALCFEAQRVSEALSRGERLWRILVVKNLAMAILITVAALPVIGFLTVSNDGNPIAMIDQLVTMVFIWLGVGNALSVLYPLRHEPVSARLRDATWKPYLFSFALSYGVGLTVNLTIFWRLWSRQTVAAELTGGEWAAFVLVLASALISWILLTVFSVACSREPRIRRVLSRELHANRLPGPDGP